MRRLVATILRRLGTRGHVLSRLLVAAFRPSARGAQSALLIGAAHILWRDVPATCRWRICRCSRCIGQARREIFRTGHAVLQPLRLEGQP